MAALIASRLPPTTPSATCAPECLDGEAGPAALSEWLDEVADLGHTMKKTSACGLGQAAPLITESLVKYFPDRVRQHVGEPA